MEKILSEEERIKRAQEISEKRKSRIPASSINLNNTKKKKISVLSKIFIQVITSICIFGLIYFLSQHNSMAIEKIKPLISNDTDFVKIYSEMNDVIKGIINDTEKNKEVSQDDNQTANKQEKSEQTNESINENNQTSQESNLTENNTQSGQIINIIEDNKDSNGIGGGNDGTQESETDQDVAYIKANANFIKPISGTITSGYGARTPTDIISANHAGVDIGANTGTEIVASMTGKVEIVSSEGDYGKHLKITNGEISTLYAHCSKIVVNKGENIEQGQKIAEVGSTGKATGPHLHFEIRRNNVTVDPQKVLQL